MKLKIGIAIIGIVLVLAVGYVAISQHDMNTKNEVTANAPSELTIVLTESGFQPREAIIKQGGTITFTNETGKPFWPASNLHPTHQLYAEFDPLRPLDADEAWAFTFERVGTHNFHDHIRAYFVGKIHVVK